MQILRSQKGFTLIELTAVIAITGILLVMISTIFVQIVQSNTRATVINDIREQGQFITETVVRSIRNADSISAPGGVTVGKVLSLTVTSAGVADTYALTCVTPNDPTTQAITKNTAQLNTTKILVDVNCSGTVDTTKSYFELVAPAAGAPAAVRVNLVLETTGTRTHQEFIGKQTFTELVTLRTYAR